MIVVSFIKKIFCACKKSDIQKLAHAVAKRDKKLKGEVEINIIGDKEMQKLNKCYRGQDMSTDVLAFAWQEDKVIKSDFLGQVYINYLQIKRQAKEVNITIEEEFKRIIVHGLLHLLGYDHKEKKEAKVMFNLQEEILEDILQ